jgi:hypothetical protein
MANVLVITPEHVNFADVFDSDSLHLIRDDTIQSTLDNLVYTQTLNAETLRVFRETATGLNYSGGLEYLRFQTGPDVPSKGPFLENLSVDGSLDKTRLVNLLLIDKPPLRTGFFQFNVGTFSFPGIITRTTEYEHYNWEQIKTGSYGYVRQETPLGYGIEISNNQLYNSVLVTENGLSFYRLTPKPLKLYLDSLTGSVELSSYSSLEDPNNYNTPVPGTVSVTTINIDLFSLSDADALRYIASYPDLILSLGADAAKGRDHYNNNGRRILFNPLSYLNKYPDLRNRFGFDSVAATIHFITTGYYENRTFEGGSGNSDLRGGLYDERFGNIPISDQSFIWNNGYTLSGQGKNLTYKLGNFAYYLNSAIQVDNQLVYMRVL